MRSKILAFAGSARKDSYNKKLIRIATEGARATGAEVTLIDLRDFPLPVFDEDLEKEQGLPAHARQLKDLFNSHQGLLIASPEYNSTISPLLKNTIDWVSRQAEGETPLMAFKGKFAGLLSASPGGLGGIRGLVAVRSLLGNIGVIVLPDQLCISKAYEAFQENGALKDEKNQEQAKNIGSQVAKWITKL